MSFSHQEYYISGFNVIVPTLVEEFDIPDASAVWPASALSLVVASTLLFFGRLADMVGGYPVYTGGMAWLTMWSAICGFSNNRLMLIICRALQGLGASAFLPSSMMLLANVYRPGPRKNIVFCIYGTCAVIGFFIGICLAGIAAQYISWQSYFWIGAALCAITTASSYFFIPSDTAECRKKGVKMDYWGTLLILPGLVLTVYAITDSGHALNGWKNPQIFVCLILGCAFIAAAIYVEGWVVESPLLPSDVFRVPYMKAVIASLFMFNGCLGVYLLYGTL
jgi:MFS family permease